VDTNTPISFADLLLAARRGCSVSQGDLFERYRKLLKMLVRIQLSGSLRAKADASDLVQETFVRAHQAFHQFQGVCEHELVAWLRSILASRLHKTMRHHRAGRRSLHLERRLEDELEQSSAALDKAFYQPGPSPSELAGQREHLTALAGAIEDLPEHYRSVIVLRQIKGLSYAEVARRMERSEDSVRKLWVRALAQLHRTMEAGL
jgi:RNA polymerase sigma-70 factor (ECF subfamily)